MKYSEVPNNIVFFFEGNPDYPKLKAGLGHVDIRDNIAGSGAGLQDHEVYLEECRQPTRTATAPLDSDIFVDDPTCRR